MPTSGLASASLSRRSACASGPVPFSQLTGSCMSFVTPACKVVATQLTAKP